MNTVVLFLYIVQAGGASQAVTSEYADYEACLHAYMQQKSVVIRMHPATKVGGVCSTKILAPAKATLGSKSS